MKNLCFIISNINKSFGFEWIATSFAHRNDYQLTFILLNPSDSELQKFLERNNISVHRLTYRGKRDLIPVIFKLVWLLIKLKINIVHTHLLDASIAGLLAAKVCGIKKRISTRHHSTLHHDYFPQGKKYDQLINSLSTDIIAISDVVKKVLIEKEGVSSEKVSIIHHGFELDKFKNINQNKINELRIKYNIPSDFIAIGVISRYLKLKGIEYIIDAFKILLNENKNCILILANANGNHSDIIKELLKELPRENYREISFENDIFSLYKLFDIFIHVPINADCEAFGQTYVEALASGIPSIFTLSGIAQEFIKDRNNAVVVPYMDSNSIYVAIQELITNQDLREKLINNGRKDVENLFIIDKMIHSLIRIYEK